MTENTGPSRASVPQALRNLIRTTTPPGAQLLDVRCPACRAYLFGYTPMHGLFTLHIECLACGFWRTVPRGQYGRLFTVPADLAPNITEYFNLTPNPDPEEEQP